LLLSSQATRLSAEIERRIGYAQVIGGSAFRTAMLACPTWPASDLRQESIRAPS
jgi:hypothetical protein